MLKSILPIAGALAGGALLIPAAAGAASPLPGYSQFTGCPSSAEPIFACQYTKIGAGEFKLGNKVVTIASPITLVGGLTSTDPSRIISTSAGGLKSAPIEVPGGLAGITGLGGAFINLITLGANKIYATPQLAGTPTVLPDGAGFRLPLKVKLSNPLLSSSCSIGSDAVPIVLNLTNGTTNPPAGVAPLMGAFPTNVYFDQATSILHSDNAIYVDNTFAVPGATGCGSYIAGINVGVINSLVNAQVGLPSAPGVSRAIQRKFDIQLADPTVVFGS